MTLERTLTKLELLPARDGKRHWVHARWWRSDDSKGEATVQLRLKTAERWYIARVMVDLPTPKLMRDVPLTRITAAVNADAGLREWIEKDVPQETVKLARRKAAERPRLERPVRRRPLEDSFFESVAAAYRGAIKHGLPPAKTMSEDSDTPPGTVNRWIAEARRRGYLPAGEPGRVTY